MLRFINKNQFKKFDPVLFYSYKMYPRLVEYSYHSTQYYIYFYLDPFICYLDDEKLGYIQLNNPSNVDTLYFAYEPIYVGKGVNKGGYRMNQHVSQFLNKKDHNYIKRKKFEEIEKKMKENGMTWNDYKNNYIIIYKTFDNEEELLENELELINKIGIQWTKTGPLVNKITKYQQEKFKRRQNEFF
jgi:hypothetical protein